VADLRNLATRGGASSSSSVSTRGSWHISDRGNAWKSDAHAAATSIAYRQ
jgi:hypothetical protein